MCLTDQTVEAGGLVPRCNTVGRTLGGRDKDKMTDCPMVLAPNLEGRIRGLADTRSHTPTLGYRRRYNHAQERWVLISEQARAVVVV